MKIQVIYWICYLIIRNTFYKCIVKSLLLQKDVKKPEYYCEIKQTRINIQSKIASLL